uniref:Uncharacterized protein n=1 Tax=Anguilla anguilla TaxID=7936 RepID=A0A0E9TBJ8_ANGAN
MTENKICCDIHNPVSFILNCNLL